MTKVLYIRTNDCSFDPRAQKEIESILKIDNISVTFFGWNREKNSKIIESSSFNIGGTEINRELICIAAPWGSGTKKNLFATFCFLRNLKKWLCQHISEFDIIHACDLPVAYIALKSLNKQKNKLIYDIYDYFPDVKRWPHFIRKLLVSIENKVISRSDATIICNDERIRQIGKAQPKKLCIIHNAPSASFLKSNNINNVLISKTKKKKFVYVGNLIEERLINLILECFSKRNDVELHIGGIGSLSNNVVEFSNKYDNIFYYGKMNYSDVISLESNCHVLIALYDPKIPNHRFISPNKFYESLSLGKQLIMCKNTGLDSYFAKYHIGTLIEPNVESLSCAIDILLSDSKNWEKYSKEENELFTNCFSWEIMESRIIYLYNFIKGNEPDKDL